MLENTFIHIQGIGSKTETGLWRRGIRCWDDFLNRGGIVFSKERDRIIEEELRVSIENIHNIKYFEERLTSAEMWRLYGSFAGRSVFLDIETNGGFDTMDEITLIGLYDGREVRTYINGRNLADFEIAAADYDLVVTFNGGSFDLPHIRRTFPSIPLPAAHIDLRFLLGKLGLKGGLKSIEKQLTIAREPAIEGLNGLDAILLWRAYTEGDQSALEKLIQYNTADIVNLKPLMEYGYEAMRKTVFYF